MNKKIPLIVLVGPTAVGKTDISIKLAKKLNGEIISADSMQIYKYMDIGTAKVKEGEKQGIPHYLIDIVYPDEDFTVSNYKDLANEHIKDINSRSKLPIVVGGTGLYINSLVYKLSFTQVVPNTEFREVYNKIADEYGNAKIYEELKKIDPISANRININDRKRIIRALEIYHETGKPMSEYNKDFRKYNDDYHIILIGLTMERNMLYERINVRVDNMIEEGLINEVEELMKIGYNRQLNSMQALGYKEIISYLYGEISLDEAIELIKRNSRKYAKRQLTWFRRDNRIKWIDTNSFSNKDEVVEYILKHVKEQIINN